MLPALVVSCGSRSSLDTGSEESDGSGGLGGIDASSAGTGGAAGAGGAGNGGAGGSGGLAAICARYAKTYCAMWASCFAGVPMYIDHDCESDNADRCVLFAGLPDSNSNAESMAACTKALATESCDQLFYAGGYLASCVIPGQRPVDAGCVADVQCESLHCDGFDEHGCGRCVPAPGPGEHCYQGSCAAGLMCRNSACKEVGLLGDKCGPSAPCGVYLRCRNGTCEKGGGVGEACPGIYGGAECDYPSGSACENEQCVQVTTAKLGDPCNGWNKVCEPGLWCWQFACVETPQRGEGCEYGVNGVPCEFSAPYWYQCVDGVCGTGDAAACN